jgi:hypothetical protein
LKSEGRFPHRTAVGLPDPGRKFPDAAIQFPVRPKHIPCFRPDGIRIVVPPELRPYLPPPHTSKANLTRALGTGNEREANRLAFPWIAEFQAAITSAASITEIPMGMTRYRACHGGQNRFPLEARLFPPFTPEAC